MAGNNSKIPVDIEFILKNLNIAKEAGKMKQNIQDVGATTEAVSEQVEANFRESFTNSAAAAQKMNASMKASATGITQVARSTGQLQFSMQQVARELPSLAISPQLFFLAISNNLPILQDNINKVRLENEALRKSGQKAVPVWKQLASSLFSWQTALVAGITVFTVYGKDIINWARDMLTFKNSVSLTTEEIKGLTKAFSENLGSELGKLNLLFDDLKQAEEGTRAYADAKNEIIDKYDEYLGGLDSEISTLNDIEGAYRAITDAIIEQARAKALNSVYEEQGQKMVNETLKQYEKIQDEFVERWGEGLGQQYFERLRQELEAGKGLSKEVREIIAEFTRSEKRAVGSTTSPGYSGFETVEINKVRDAIDEVTKAQEKFNQKTNDARLFLGKLYSETSPDNTQTIEKQIKETEDLLVSAESRLRELRAAGSTATVKEIKDQEKAVKELQQKLATLTGKAVKGLTDEDKAEFIKSLEEKEKEYLNYNAALRQYGEEWANDHYKILLEDGRTFKEFLERQVDQYRDSREKMAAIAEKAQDSNILLFEPQYKPIEDTVKKVKIKGVAPLLDTKQLASLDNWYKKLEERLTGLNEELKKETLDNYGKNLIDTAYMLDDIGFRMSELDEDAADFIQVVARATGDIGNLLTGIAQGNPFQAVSGGIGLLIQAIDTLSGSDSTDKLNDKLETINETLERQSAILAALNGENYFLLAKKQVDEYSRAIDVSTQKLREMSILTEEEYKQQYELFLQLKKDFPNIYGQINFDQFAEGISSITDSWAPDQFIDAWLNGAIYLDEEGQKIIEEIVNSRAAQLDLLEQQFSEMLGFTGSDITTGIADAIISGFELAENGLGDFAETFGDLMQQYGRKALETFIDQQFLSDFYKKAYDLANDTDGITAEDKRILEDAYREMVESAQGFYEGISGLFENEQEIRSPLSGSAIGATEESVSLLFGQITALRVDVKSILAKMVEHDDDFVRRLAYLREIAENTRYNSHLQSIDEKLTSVNENLRAIK